MAVRRKRTTTPRKRTTTRRRTTTPVKSTRRVTRRSKSMLSEFFNATSAQAGAKVCISGAVGGIGAGLVSKLMPASVSIEMKSVYLLGAGFITATMLKMPNVGAGMAAVGAYQIFKDKGFLAEDDENFDYANSLDSLPMVLNEDQALYLQESDGMYLSEDMSYNLSEDDNSYSVGYYPEFGGF
jgi:hypothetical protein